jgi:LPS sulfotransferase NodH
LAPDPQQTQDPPEPHTEKPRPCFIIARPRSGTTVFSKMLQTHPGVVSMGEIFNEANPASYFKFVQTLVATNPAALLPSNSNRMFLEYVQSCIARALESNPQCRIVVLDVKYDQAHLLCEPWLRLGELPRLYFLLREQKWKVIDIHRRDPFRLSISNRVAIQSRLYHSNMLEPGRKQTAKIHIDPARLAEDVAATRKAYAAVERHFRRRPQYRQIYYEDMFADAAGTRFSGPLLAEIARFLNLGNTFDPKPKLQKLLQEDICFYIKNAAQIRALMAADPLNLRAGEKSDAVKALVRNDAG